MEDEARQEHNERVARYYAHSWFGYKWFWQDRRNRALHFGYWDSDTRNHSDSLLNMNREIARPLDLRPGLKVLDAGCGVGGSSMWLADNFGVDVLGITITETQIELANGFAQERGLQDSVAYELRDFCDTGLPSESFDVVWAQESSCHAEDKGQFLKEAFRVLKPGGMLAVEDWFRETRSLAPTDEKMLHGWISCWAIPDLETIEEFTQKAGDAGFGDITSRDLTMYVRPSLRRLYRNSVLSYPPAWVAHRLGMLGTDDHLNHVGAIRQWRALNRRLWFDALVHARKPHDA